MTNQTLSPRGTAGPKPLKDRDLAVYLLIVFGVLALVVITATTLRDEPVVTTPLSTIKRIEQPFSTQPYWDKAAEYELSKRAAGASAVEQPATYTQPYWDKAAEYELNKRAAATQADEQPATYTQPYWDKAAEYELNKRAATPSAQETEPEWAYYTERYWSRTR
jgi:hypothetical protein